MPKKHTITDRQLEAKIRHLKVLLERSRRALQESKALLAAQSKYRQELRASLEDAQRLLSRRS